MVRRPGTSVKNGFFYKNGLHFSRQGIYLMYHN